MSANEVCELHSRARRISGREKPLGMGLAMATESPLKCSRFSALLMRAIALLGVLTCLVIALTGCGGSSSGPVPQKASRTAVQVRMADAPSDLVISCQLTITSIVATALDNTTTTLLSQPTTVEVAHLADAGQPLASLDMAQGDYSSVSVAVSSASITFLNTSTGAPQQQQFTLNTVSTVAFSPALTIASTPMVLNFDFDVPSSVNVDTVNNTVSMNSPVFHATGATVGPSAGQQTTENGGVKHVVGTVASVAANSFTVEVGQSGTSLTFQTDANTVFQNTALSTLANTIVIVHGTSQDDGSLLANSVEGLEAASGVEMEGLVLGYNGSDTLNFVVQDGSGQAITPATVGATMSVDERQVSDFRIDSSDVDLTGLNFATFDGSNFVRGQRVQVEGPAALQVDPAGNAGLMAPASITLEPQTVAGIVTNYQPGQNPGSFEFDLLLPLDGTSYLTVIDPTITVVHVVQQAATDVSGLQSSLANGDQVRVRGLMFYSLVVPNGAIAGKPKPLVVPQQNPVPYMMVAAKISSGA